MIGMALLGMVIGAGIVAYASKYIEHIVSFVKNISNMLRQEGIISEGMETFINNVANKFESIFVNYYQTGNQWYQKTTTKAISPSEVPDHIRNKNGNTNTTSEVKERLEEALTN